MADEVRGAQLEIVFLAGRNTPQAPHRLNDFTLRRFHVYVLRNRERHNQFFRLRVLLLEAAQGNYGEDIHAGSDKQALVVLEHADHFVNAAVDTHSLAEGVSVGEERFADGRSKDDYWARMLLVEGADEASTLDAEKGDGVDVLWLGAAHDDLLDAIVPAGDQIRIAEETPITIPSTVNAERTLDERSVSMAAKKFSRACASVIIAISQTSKRQRGPAVKRAPPDRSRKTIRLQSSGLLPEPRPTFAQKPGKACRCAERAPPGIPSRCQRLPRRYIGSRFLQ